MSNMHILPGVQTICPEIEIIKDFLKKSTSTAHFSCWEGYAENEEPHAAKTSTKLGKPYNILSLAFKVFMNNTICPTSSLFHYDFLIILCSLVSINVVLFVSSSKREQYVFMAHEALI